MPHRIKLILSILALIFLSACTNESGTSAVPDEPLPLPEPVPAPPNPDILGLMEISFNRVGSEGMTSSARNVTSGLSLQGLDEQGSGVDIKLLSKSAVDDVANGVRYLYATYEVRNAQYCNTPGSCTAYSDARDNLTFLAVSTSSTVNGSALARLEKFDGNPAATSIALDVMPTHGMTSSFAVDNALADMQVYTEAELAVFTPAGSSVTSVMPYGFVTRSKNSSTSRALAANPAVDNFEGKVTFALKLPLQADPADDPYKINLMVLVVDDSNTRVTESVEEQGSSGAETRADALEPDAEVALLGTSSTTVTGNSLTRVCQVRVAGTAASPTAYLVNATTGDCAPSAPTVNSFVHNKDETVGQIGQAITFSWDIDATEGDPVDCTLDMGDGTTYTVENCQDTSSQTHSYSTADIYAVTLTATDDDGSTEKLTVPTVASFDSSVYNIDVLFDVDSEWSSTYIDVFKSAAERWGEIITGDVSLVNISTSGYSGLVDDLVIKASISYIDGVGGTLGQAGPRTARSGYISAYGIMEFDSADMANMASVGTLENVILHEMAHVIGIGSLWDLKGFIDTSAHTYSAANGVAEYSTLTGSSETTVPIEDTGGAGSLNSHWDESTFISELMTSSISSAQTTAASAPIARLTIGGLEDFGYAVDYSKADSYSLPSGSSILAPAGEMMPHSTPVTLDEIEFLPANDSR